MVQQTPKGVGWGAGSLTSRKTVLQRDRQEGKAWVLKVSNLTGRYSSEEARRRSREGPRTLPIYVGSTRIPPQPVEQSPKHCSAIVRRFSVFRSLP
eukprot:COSAG02_NODE_2145_length_9672_cov_1198.924266_12_plen_96_part_00